MKRLLISAVFILSVSACAPTVEENGLTSGLSLSPAAGGYYVRFKGTRLLSDEAVQAYWLYNSAVWTLQKGYDGFALTGSMLGVSDPHQNPDIALFGPVGSLLPGLDPGKVMQANIDLFRKPFPTSPSPVFDAALVKGRLEEFVKKGSCNGANPCPHPLALLVSAQ